MRTSNFHLHSISSPTQRLWKSHINPAAAVARLSIRPFHSLVAHLPLFKPALSAFELIIQALRCALQASAWIPRRLASGRPVLSSGLGCSAEAARRDLDHEAGSLCRSCTAIDEPDTASQAWVWSTDNATAFSAYPACWPASIALHPIISPHVRQVYVVHATWRTQNFV